jgi:hypothetical protein
VCAAVSCGIFTNHESPFVATQGKRITNHLRATRPIAGTLGLPYYGGVQDETLVVTTRNKDCEDHQVGVREQQAACLVPANPRGARQGTQVFAAGQVAQMFAADAGQAGDLFLGEDFLTRLDGDQCGPSISAACAAAWQSLCVATVQVSLKTVPMIRSN